MYRLPSLDYRTRLAAIAGGVITLLWMSLEDSHNGPVTLLALGLTSLAIWLGLLRAAGGRSFDPRWVIVFGLVLGALAGAATAVVTAGLMFFKNAWHAHSFPDFPLEMLLAALMRGPAWAAAGMLAGLGLALFWLGWREKKGVRAGSPRQEENRSIK